MLGPVERLAGGSFLMGPGEGPLEARKHLNFIENYGIVQSFRALRKLGQDMLLT